jgi:DNA end-binding protein Ku
MLAAIERKVAGQEITEEPAEEPRAQVIDLMDALKASLARQESGRRPAQRAAAKAAGRSRARKKSSSS